MIKLADIKDRTNWVYSLSLKNNLEYANQLVATLNQVNGFSSNKLIFSANSNYWTYDYWFSPNNEIDKNTFLIFFNNQIEIRSTNRYDLLNSHYYQALVQLANKHLDKKRRWIYFPQDRVLQLDIDYTYDIYLNIKLTKPIDQYDQNQLGEVGQLMTNIYNLIINDDELDWDRFDDKWKQGFDEIKDIGIVFDLNNFANPKILVRWLDENDEYQYQNDHLKQVLKDDSPLLKYLESNDFQTNFLNDNGNDRT